MRKIILLLALAFIQCEQPQTKTEQQNDEPSFGIVIHGGAGTILKKNMTPELEKEYRTVLAQAIEVGHAILKEGGSSQEAVEKTIHVMENSPLFNAGKGAVLIIPILDECVLFIKEYAAGVDDYMITLPKGRIDENEDMYAAANRELKEEVGYKYNNIFKSKRY